VNHEDRFVIFGAWDSRNDGSKVLILDEHWQISRRGRKQPAYAQSREHIRLIEENGYALYTFDMQHARADENDVESPAKIAGFTPELVKRSLVKIRHGWYAISENFPSASGKGT